MDPTNATGGSIDQDLSLLVTSPTMVSIQASFSCNVRLGLVMGSMGMDRGSFGGFARAGTETGPGKFTEVIRRRGWVIKPRENAEHGETTYVESSIQDHRECSSRQGTVTIALKGRSDDRPVGAKRRLGTESSAPKVEDVTVQPVAIAILKRWTGRRNHSGLLSECIRLD